MGRLTPRGDSVCNGIVMHDLYSMLNGLCCAGRADGIGTGFAMRGVACLTWKCSMCAADNYVFVRSIVFRVGADITGDAVH